MLVVIGTDCMGSFSIVMYEELNIKLVTEILLKVALNTITLTLTLTLSIG
jgi:hypothetical protein